jgi:hypothetical protein
MAFVAKSGACGVHYFGHFLRRSCIGIQFVRCQSIVAEKLVYSEYGDAVKVVRQEKVNLPAPKDNEVFLVRY